MSTMDTIRQLARQAKNEGIVLDRARLCTVCWTVHESDACPECEARQWLYLVPMLKGFEAREGMLAETYQEQTQ
jgi:hypothetical protein